MLTQTYAHAYTVITIVHIKIPTFKYSCMYLLIDTPKKVTKRMINKVILMKIKRYVKIKIGHLYDVSVIRNFGISSKKFRA